MSKVTDRDKQFLHRDENVPTVVDLDFIQMLQSNFPWQFSNQSYVVEDDDNNYSFNGISNTNYPLSEFDKQKRRAQIYASDTSNEESDDEEAIAREEKKNKESYEKFVSLAVASKRCRTAGKYFLNNFQKQP